MGALLIFLVAGVYIAAGLLIYRKLSSQVVRAFTVALWLLIPTADAVYGRVELKRLCAADGGTKINKTVTGISGFYTRKIYDSDVWITKLGYTFLEIDAAERGFSRKTRGPDGQIIEQSVDRLQSTYGIREDSGNFGPDFKRQRILVDSLSTSEELAAFTDFHFVGGWAEQMMAGLYGGTSAVADCGYAFRPLERAIELVTASLQPVK